MNTAVGVGGNELLAELRRLCAHLPMPQPDWHPDVPQIVACRDDFEHALALAEAHPETLDLVASLLDDELDLHFDPNVSPGLTAAWRRLEALPMAANQHPHLDEILPAFEALRLLLIARSQTAAVR